MIHAFRDPSVEIIVLPGRWWRKNIAAIVQGICAGPYVRHGFIRRVLEIVESATYKHWIRGLRDRCAVVRTNARSRNVSLGNTGDAKHVGSELFEMCVHHGPGYRLYCLREGSTLVLLCGGDKGSQQRDIERAGRLAEDWRQT